MAQTQYSKELGVHDYFEHSDVPQLKAVSRAECEILLADPVLTSKTRTTIVKWHCICGGIKFQLFAAGYETYAKCAECGNERLIHQG